MIWYLQRSLNWTETHCFYFLLSKWKDSYFSDGSIQNLIPKIIELWQLPLAWVATEDVYSLSR